MNILYCGDSNIEKGLLISILSLLKNAKEELNIYVLTIGLNTPEKTYKEVSDTAIDFLNNKVKEKNEKSFVKKINIENLFEAQKPTSNMKTRFTPFCMLRLYADQIEELPDRILYLDNDVICRKNPEEFYNQDIENHELIGVLDYYGRWFFRKNILRFDYLNSGVLLLNLKEIKRTGLFEKCRAMCQKKEMFMPDQSSINKLSKTKKIAKRKYNEQRRLKKDTVFQHFTTSFRLFPMFHSVTIKPWDIQRVHNELKIHEYDDILNEYEKLLPEMKGEIVYE